MTCSNNCDILAKTMDTFSRQNDAASRARST